EVATLNVPDIKTRLRQIGVEPEDFPGCTDRTDLVNLYREKAAAKNEENKDLKRQRELQKMSPKERQKFLADERQAMALKQQDEFKKEYEELLAKGEGWAMVKAMQNIWKKNMEENKKRAKNNTLEGSAGRMAAMMDEMEGMEGRCTLVTTIQMYQILALNCLINAYSLSKLRLDGVKYGDRQMTCLGILMSVSFVTISRSKPLDQLSSVRPLKSIFHPALFISIVGQFALHIFTMYYLVKEGKTYLSADHPVDLDSEYKPSVVNSVVFLVTAVQQVSVFVVNLKGPPFMGGLAQNTPLLWSLAVTFVGTFMCASESIPQLNQFLQLEPFPSIAFRNTVLVALAIDVTGAFLWDRLLLAIFAYPVLKASLENTTKKEMMTIIRVVAVVCALVYWLASQDYTELIEEMERQEELARLSESGSVAG
ncbi:Atp13a1, partial [Symbiodinium microadriaticum]